MAHKLCHVWSVVVVGVVVVVVGVNVVGLIVVSAATNKKWRTGKRPLILKTCS